MKPSAFAIAAFLITTLSNAQHPVQFFAHEDHVKPSMNASYRGLLKKIKETYEKNQVNTTYSVLVQDDNTYYVFSPMENFNIRAVYNSFSDIESKVGKDVFQNLLQEKSAFIDSHHDFITQLVPEYTYLSPPEDEHYRHMMFWVPLPEKEAESHQIAQEWIKLHKSKNAPGGYQTFRTMFGPHPGWVIVTWGKNEIDRISKSQKNNELLGDDAAKLWARTMAITQKIDRKNGWFLPELSYTSRPLAVK